MGGGGGGGCQGGHFERKRRMGEGLDLTCRITIACPLTADSNCTQDSTLPTHTHTHIGREGERGRERERDERSLRTGAAAKGLHPS